MTLVLASASPRRRQLLDWAGIAVRVQPSDIDEAWLDSEHPADAAERLAREKAEAIPTGSWILASDTVVHLDDEPFGKPTDAADAARMLRKLNGMWHHVTTGVAIVHPEGLHSFRETTSVRFRTLRASDIDRYVASGEPMGKAGAYAIQGQGGALIAEVRGCWTNVMGLPVDATVRALHELGAPFVP